MEIFEYEFIRKAFVVGMLLATLLPCIGIIIVLKRLSMVGDALAHTSLVGVTLGLLLGFDPIVGSVASCIVGALSIELIRKYIPKYQENAIVVVLALATGLAGIISSYLKNSTSFQSFLFGSIVSIKDTELYFIIALTIIVLATFIFLYQQLLHIALDEKSAMRIGIPVRRINFIFTLLTAITISISARTIGALLVSSLLVIPILCAMRLARNFKQTLIYGMLFSNSFVIIGLFLSYHADIRPGGSITICAVVTYLLLLVLRNRK